MPPATTAIVESSAASCDAESMPFARPDAITIFFFANLAAILLAKLRP